jgi:S-formylglutathione hydrolase FrmB
MMNFRKLGVAAALSLGVLVALASCSQTENPLSRASAQEPSSFTRESLSFDELALNDYFDPPTRQIVIAYVTGENPSLPQQPMPVLYLLHDWSGGATYFEMQYNLQTTLDDMFRNGEVGRMMVVTVDASNGLGGSFYRNAGTMGRYEDLMESTIEHVEKYARAYTQGGRHARAISGHGMGGYGAFRFALDRPDMFGAVSSMSGPLSLGEYDFDAEYGIVPHLLSDVLSENGIAIPDTTKDIYPRLAIGRYLFEKTALFMAMTGGFSPRPMRQFDSLGALVLCRPFWHCQLLDTFYNQPFFSALPPGPQTLRLTDIGDTVGVGLDMIFDSTGVHAPDIWQRWHDTADVKTVFARKRQADPTFFDDVPMYFDVGADDEFGFKEQNDNFRDFLESAGITNYQYEVYDGYGSTPAGHWELIQTRLREVIKFHDTLFVRPTPPRP